MFFFGILEEGYLETEITSLFGMSAHLTFFQQFFSFLQRKGDVLSEAGLKDFLALALTDFLDPEKERLIEFRGAPDLLGSFFQFIVNITGEKAVDCLLNILRRILSEGKDARTIIEQTISMAWEDIPSQWVEDIIREVE